VDREEVGDATPVNAGLCAPARAPACAEEKIEARIGVEEEQEGGQSRRSEQQQGHALGGAYRAQCVGRQPAPAGFLSA